MATPNNALVLREEQQSLAPRSAQITDVQRLGGLLAASGYFSDAREMAQAAVKVLAGEELGIPPVAAMMGINIIKGKVALSGNLIASRIRAHGYDYRHKRFDNTGCVLEFLSKPGEGGKRTTLGESSFTEEDAKAAGVLSDMYRKYPRNMYFNRAISNGAKWYTPEVFAGAPVYVPEELGARIDEQGDYLPEEPTPAQQAKARDAVRDAKLAEIRQCQAGKLSEAAQNATAQQPEPDSAGLQQQSGSNLPPTITEFRAMTKAEKIAMFGAMKQIVGEETYYRVLGINGAAHANEFATLNAAVKAYSELLAEYQDQVRSRAI